jgi:hypothetical protein
MSESRPSNANEVIAATDEPSPSLFRRLMTVADNALRISAQER